MIDNRILRRLVACLALLCASVALAQTPVRTMMERTGMVAVYKGIDEQIRVGVLDSVREQADFPQMHAEAFASIAGDAFEPDRFLDDLEARMADSLVAAELAAMENFYASPLGERLKAVESRAADPAQIREVQERKVELGAALERDEPRLEIVRRIDEALLASELTAALATNMGIAFAAGAVESEKRGMGPEFAEAMRMQMAAAHQELVATMRQEVYASFAHTYREISVSDLAAYSKFLETREARSVSAAHFAAVDEIFSLRGREIGRAFGAYLQEKRT